jgi:hypothetical protein
MYKKIHLLAQYWPSVFLGRPRPNFVWAGCDPFSSWACLDPISFGMNLGPVSVGSTHIIEPSPSHYIFIILYYI